MPSSGDYFMQQPPLAAIHPHTYHQAQRLYLLIVALGSGLFTAVIEKATTRLLVPLVGSTVYTELGILSALMLCLAIGYYIGGYITANYTTSPLLYILLLGVGSYTSLLSRWVAAGVHLLTAWVTIHPLHIFLASWSSTLLLAVPLVGIGIIVSLVVQLNTYQSIEKAGKTVGKIIGWTTLGTIVGGSLATFLSLPFLGTANTILYSGLLLLVIAIIGFLVISLRTTPVTKVK